MSLTFAATTARRWLTALTDRKHKTLHKTIKTKTQKDLVSLTHCVLNNIISSLHIDPQDRPPDTWTESRPQDQDRDQDQDQDRDQDQDQGQDPDPDPLRARHPRH